MYLNLRMKSVCTVYNVQKFTVCKHIYLIYLYKSTCKCMHLYKYV